MPSAGSQLWLLIWTMDLNPCVPTWVQSTSCWISTPKMNTPPKSSSAFVPSRRSLYLHTAEHPSSSCQESWPSTLAWWSDYGFTPYQQQIVCRPPLAHAILLQVSTSTTNIIAHWNLENTPKYTREVATLWLNVPQVPLPYVWLEMIKEDGSS